MISCKMNLANLTNMPQENKRVFLCEIWDFRVTDNRIFGTKGIYSQIEDLLLLEQLSH